MNKDKEFIMRPKVDFCFKGLMEDEEIRRGFIAAVLGVAPEEIVRTNLLPTHLRKEHETDKLGILDVRVMLSGKIQVDIEIQLEMFDAWAERTLFYLSKMYVQQIHKGDSYDKLKKCIHIGILDFSLFDQDEDYYSCFHIWEDKRRRKYSDKFELHILELPKLVKYEYPQTELLNWARFLNAEKKEEFEMIAKTNGFLERAYERLMDMSEDEEKRLEYEAREKALRDYNYQMQNNLKAGFEKGLSEGLSQGLSQGLSEGLSQGIAQGREQGAVEMLQDMKASFEEAVVKIREKFLMTEEEARMCVKKYWK